MSVLKDLSLDRKQFARYETAAAPAASRHADPDVIGNDRAFVDPSDIITQFFTITPTSLIINPTAPPLTQAVFDLLGAKLAADIDALKWQIASWCNLYRAQFGGNAYERAAAMVGFKWSISTIERWAWIERNVCQQARVPARIDGELTGMSIYWHEFVIGLPGQLQTELLSHCLREKMPIHEFEAYCDKQRATVATPEPVKKRLTKDYVFELTETLAVTEAKLNEAVVEASQLSKTIVTVTDKVTRYEAVLLAAVGLLTGRG